MQLRKSTTNSIVFKKVTKSYGGKKPLLDKVDQTIEDGEFVFLTGPSGSGKTTVLNLIGRIEFPTSGKIEIGGKKISSVWANVPALRKKIGFVYQDGKLLESRTILSNIELPLLIDRVNPKLIQARVAEVAQQCLLKDILRQKVESLSGGQKQLTALARALMRKPSIIIADEPTANLDRINALEILRLLITLHKSGNTVIVATHDTGLIQSYDGRILFIKNSRIIDY